MPATSTTLPYRTTGVIDTIDYLLFAPDLEPLRRDSRFIGALSSSSEQFNRMIARQCPPEEILSALCGHMGKKGSGFSAFPFLSHDGTETFALLQQPGEEGQRQVATQMMALLKQVQQLARKHPS